MIANVHFYYSSRNNVFSSFLNIKISNVNESLLKENLSNVLSGKPKRQGSIFIKHQEEKGMKRKRSDARAASDEPKNSALQSRSTDCSEKQTIQSDHSIVVPTKSDHEQGVDKGGKQEYATHQQTQNKPIRASTCSKNADQISARESAQDNSEKVCASKEDQAIKETAPSNTEDVSSRPKKLRNEAPETPSAKLIFSTYRHPLFPKFK